MNKEKEYLEVDRGVAEGTKTLDELAEESGVFEKPARPVPVEEPVLSPEHEDAPEHVVPKEHDIPLEEAAERLNENEEKK